MDCPDAEEVQAYLDGRATGDARERLDAHARACSGCRDVIALSRTPAAGEELAPEMLVAGTVVGGFVVERVLGAGAIGVVYGAHDPALDRRVALKVLREESPDRRERFAREAQALARVTHPNVCGVYAIGEHEGRLFIAMEHVDGETLGQWLRAGSRPRAEILARFAAAARGLAAAHAAGVVHRDFKPDNVLVGKDGRVRVSDFGLAGWLGTPADGAGSPSVRVTQTGTVMGTPVYMAPEQHAGAVADERSDQFSFAVALFEALHGTPPFAGDTLPVLADNVRAGRTRPVPSRLPRRLDRVVRRALAVDPAERFASMHQVAAELERPARRLRWLGAAALVAAAAVAALLLWPELSLDERCQRGDGAACAAAAEPWRASTDLATAGPRMAALYRTGCDAGHLPACTRLALLLVQGLGVTAAPERAHPLLLRACQGGEALACAHLGMMYERDEPIAPDAARAAEAYQRSCAAGNGLGCALRGGLRLRGHGLPLDRAAALDDFRLGCQRGSSLGCSQAAEEMFDALAPAAEAEARTLAARARELAEEGCRVGDPGDCVVLGLDGLRDWSESRDFGRATAAFQRGCDAGGGHACALLARLYLTGLGVPIDGARAVALYQRSCDRSYATGCARWGLVLAEGMGVPVDADKGRAILERQCARRAGICWPLGRIYQTGKANLPVDTARALELFRHDCDTTYEHASEGCWRVGRAHGPGGIGPLDPAEERAKLTRACDLGSTRGCELLAELELRDGHPREAFVLVTDACRSAGVSCELLATFHLEGTGTPKDVTRALRLLEETCAVGDGMACHRLGTLQLDGRHLPANPSRALDAFEKGCAAFEGPPCLAAAKLLEGGQGLAAQPARAAELQRLACKYLPELCAP